MTGKRSHSGAWKVAILVVIPLFALLCAVKVTATAHAAVVSNIAVERHLSVFVPCANGGAGEVIEVSGPVHLVASITLDGSGGFHEHILFNPQGVSGVGLTTGLKYQGVGQEQLDLNGTVGVTHTFLYVFDMIGQGPGNDLKIHETFHFTINADGTLTAYVDNPNITCQ